MKLFLYECNGKTSVGYADGPTGPSLNFSKAFALYQQAVDGKEACDIEYLTSIDDLLRSEMDIGLTVNAVANFVSETRLGIRLAVPENAKILAPVQKPSKIIALGRNYAAHAEETGAEIPTEPIYFSKAPSSIIGPGDEIVYPQDAERVDPEVELGVVIGVRCRNVAREHAEGVIAGYTIVNDVTERSLQAKDIENSHPWFRSKSYDTFCPLGPFLVLKDEIPDPQKLELELRINGKVTQAESTSRMLFGVYELVERISEHITLEPGDIISTGTPHGISPIVPGDVVEAEIKGIGILRNTVVIEQDRDFEWVE